MGTIDVDGLTKDYGEVLGADDLTFTVEEGEIFGFLGPNGAGKTTTIRLLLGLLEPTDGTARVLGADVRDESELIEAKRRLGYLPADLGFDEKATGERVLEYFGSVQGDGRREELLELFTPPLEREIREYSSGNKQMLGLVQTFMHDPDLVIMDEPTSGLDPLKQERLLEFLRAERDRGTTIFFSSHVLSEVRRVCDRVGILREGRLVALEDVESLLDRGGKQVRLRLAEPEKEFGPIDGVAELETTGRSITFTYTGEYNALLSHLASYDVVDVEIDEPALETIFMHYYGDANEEVEARADAETVDDETREPSAEPTTEETDA
ncbi:ABC transporter ATP-binding protein [Halostagnicola sp. A-GB9-2]|uniref:ABC transporter ATP-binding protein n=1 Tax=Halostagnicola sp. A-GB9-2 TaxID=3048066 RepID=UPI0024BF1188|nr:ABC transporter ATP-binding protein [Halostagnicola sp. A-GB9-2]MDJ1432855.1 ABC transporter ATP-binding protein [Halostagnicola sp. A-GB9-2]